MKKEKMKLVIYFLLLLFFNIYYIYVVLLHRAGILYLSLSIIFLPFYFLLLKKYKEYELKKRRIKLHEIWTKKKKRRIELSVIKTLYNRISEKETGERKDNASRENLFVDNQTWQDLNLDEVYTGMDYTLTSPGESVLYNILRSPLYNIGDIVKRDTIISGFQEDKNKREAVGLELLKLGYQNDNSLVELLWSELPDSTPFGFLFTLLAFIAFLVILSFFFYGGISFLYLFFIMSLNMIIIHNFKKTYLNELPVESISYLVSLIKTAGRISSLDIDIIKEYREELKDLVKRTRPLTRKISFLIPRNSNSDLDFLMEYINILFLLEIRNFNSALTEMKKNQDELKKIYGLIGEIDVFLALVSYRDSLKYYCTPEIEENQEKRELEIKQVFHPLLEEPVPNSITMKNQGVIITGSNMAGKSTFLRTVGLCVLMAQTISTCPARSYRGVLLRIISSISRTDSIVAGKSFYFAEAERLLQLIRTVDCEIPSLCIIDELLAGTNSLERLYASQEILNYLYKNNVLSIIATHDLDLADKLKDKYSLFHFTDNVAKDGLHFDYTMKEGIATTVNAIKLLEYLDYPAEITDRAMEQIVSKKAGLRGKE